MAHRTTREGRGSGLRATLDTPARSPALVAAGLVVVVILVVAAAGGSPVASAAGGSARARTIAAQGGLPTLPPPPAITWSACPTAPAIQCGTVSVPLDYRDPARGTLAIAVTRAPAVDPSGPTGTLVFNPGGPGESGNQILPLILGLFPPAVRHRFAVVSFDPRGTGASEPLRCGTDPSALSSANPVPASPGFALPGTPVYAAMARACFALPRTIAPFIDTTNTARDLDRIRQALGVRTISYYGTSYGTVLGALYADLFPARVAKMVLDGAVDLNASLPRQAAEEAPAAERSLNHLFATCAAQPGCALGPHPEATFERVATSLARAPLPAPGQGDNQPVTVGDLDTATLLALSVPQSTANYESAVAQAASGSGGALRTLALSFVVDIDGAPLGDALWAITCNDASAHPGPVTAGTLARTLAHRYPLIGGYAVNYTMGGCVSWPHALQPVTHLYPRHTPPVLVIGNTGDPNTPIIAAAHLAAAFTDATMVTWAGWGHTWLLSGAGDSCMQELVTTYLSGGGTPRRGTVCH